MARLLPRHQALRPSYRRKKNGSRRRFWTGGSSLGLLLLLSAAFIAFIPDHAPSREPVQSSVLLYYGPSSELARVDQNLLGRAQKTIDMAAYILSDHGVIGALGAAAGRGVRVRLYLDGDEMAQARDSDAFDALSVTKNVTIKFKARKSEIMHLKSYVVDGKLLRTGSTNFTHSGETVQDNDIAVMDNIWLAGNFLKAFEAMWARPDNIGVLRSLR